MVIFPEEWKLTITIPLVKKGDRKNPDIYRFITQFSTSIKLPTTIILSKLQIEVLDEEGFVQTEATSSNGESD